MKQLLSRIRCLMLGHSYEWVIDRTYGNETCDCSRCGRKAPEFAVTLPALIHDLYSLLAECWDYIFTR